MVEKRATLTELTRTYDEKDAQRLAEEQDAIRVEAMKLRNKLSQNKMSTIDTEAQRAISRLEGRVNVLALEVDSLRRMFGQLLEYKV